jgi:hypothetical protein
MLRFLSSRFDISAALWLSAGIVVFWLFGYAEIKAGDLWWHIAAGQLILENGSPWLVDSWSYTASGSVWLNHEWLSDVLFYAWTSAFGLAALAYWKWLVIVIAYALLQRTLFRLCGNQAAAFLGAVFAIAVAEPYLDVRPHLYTLLNYCLLLMLVLERKQSRWILAPFFVIWVNLHGGFFFGLLALAVLVAPWRNIRLSSLQVASVTMLICFAAAALNPLGVEAFFYPLKYVFDDSSPFRRIAEWRGPFEEGGIQAPLYTWAIGLFLVSAAAYLLPTVRRGREIPFERLALAGLTLAMSLTSRRFIPLFGISAVLVMTPIAAVLLENLQAKFRRGVTTPPAAAMSGILTPSFVLAVGLILLVRYPQTPSHAFHYLTAQYDYPVDTVNFVEANDLAGKMFAHYSWGGYLHLRTRGRIKVFIDGRADTVYDAKTYLEYHDVARHKPKWMDVIESSGAEYFLWPLKRNGGTAKRRALLATRRWHPLYEDSISYLLVKSTVQLPAVIEPLGDSAYLSLARGMKSLREDDLNEAERHFYEAVKRLPYLRPACFMLAQTQARLGKRTAAHERIETCARLYPGTTGLARTRALIEKVLSQGGSRANR